jgi:hypothetical protein
MTYCKNKGCCNNKDGVCLIAWDSCPSRKNTVIFYEEGSESIYTGRNMK